MANNTLDKAIEAIPNFGKRIKLFTEKLRIAQYADNSIYDYRLKIAQAVLFFNKLPKEFTLAQLITALKRCGRDIDARSAIHQFFTQKRVVTVSHHHYRKLRVS